LWREKILLISIVDINRYHRRMDDEVASIQAAKNAHAASVDPPIEPCTNARCKFVGCTCGSRCGCNVQDASTLLISCDPCEEFKKKMKAQHKGEAKSA